MNDKENQHEVAEKESTPEQRITQLTTKARELFDKYNIPSRTGEDGSTVRIIQPVSTIGSQYSFATLKERTPVEEGTPKEYEYSYALNDRLIDTQVMRWEEQGTELTQGVRFTEYPNEPFQVVRVDELSSKALDMLETRLAFLEGSYQNDLISEARVAEHKAQRSVTGLGRIQSAFGKIISRKK